MVALLAIPTIVVGLLAMHLLTTATMAESGTPAMATHHVSDIAVGPSAAEMVADVNPDAPGPAEDCGWGCGPGHNMLEMICGLALLVTAVLLMLRLTFAHRAHVRRSISALVANAAALAPPPPPSLLVLSISRT